MNHEMTHLRVNLSKEWFISIDIIATDNQSVPVWIIFRSENKMKKTYRVRDPQTMARDVSRTRIFPVGQDWYGFYFDWESFDIPDKSQSVLGQWIPSTVRTFCCT